MATEEMHFRTKQLCRLNFWNSERASWIQELTGKIGLLVGGGGKCAGVWRECQLGANKRPSRNSPTTKSSSDSVSSRC